MRGLILPLSLAGGLVIGCGKADAGDQAAARPYRPGSLTGGPSGSSSRRPGSWSPSARSWSSHRFPGSFSFSR